MASFHWYALPALLGVAVSLAISWHAWRRRPGGAWSYVALLGLTVAWWCAGQATWILLDFHGPRLLLAQLQYVGIVTTPVAILLVALAFTGRRAWLTPWRRAAFFVLPAVTLALVFTNPLHGLIWQTFEPVAAAPRAVIRYGSWFFVHTFYSYSLTFLGTALLALRFAASPLYRLQLVVVVAGPSLVLIANLLQLTARANLPIDPTPTSFAITFAAIAWAIFRHRLFEVAPLARGLTVERLHDGMLVLDAAGRVVDSNPAARTLLNIDPTAALGSSLASLLPSLADLEDGATRELRLGGNRRVEARLSTLDTPGHPAQGRVLLLRDVTAEREAQDRLLEAQHQLEAANLELERLAHTDALTGLANRRRLMARLEEEWSRARRQGRPLSLLMLDLDHFKAINDQHGHSTGDRVLEAVGRALLPLLRTTDLAARYGGEEIALLLPETNLEGATEVAHRIVEVLRGLHHSNEQGEALTVTVSLGLATLDDPEENPRTLFQRADAALYHTKATGRDGVARFTTTGIERVGP